MKKQIIAILICIVCAGQLLAGGQNEALDALREAEEKLAEFMPKIDAIEGNKAGDVEIQLGIALLDDLPFDKKRKTRKSQYKKVLQIAPDNKIAWAVQTKRFCLRYTAQRRCIIDDLRRMIDIAKKRNVDEIKIPWYSTSMLKYFNENDKGVIKGKARGSGKIEGTYPIIITDLDLAPKIVVEKLDKEATVVLKELNKAEAMHSENALYNYLKAHFYFEIGEHDKALKEVEKAIEKPSLNNYYNESSAAIERLLSEIDFPEPHRGFITGLRIPFAVFIGDRLWKKRMADIAEDYEKKGELKKAQKMYEIGIKMASQEEKDSGKLSHLKQKIKVRSSKLEGVE